MIKNGDKVKDIVTGVEGIVIGITSWLTGCDTAGIQQKMTKDGKKPDPEWVDVTRLKVTSKKPIELTGTKTTRTAGGPQATPRQR